MPFTADELTNIANSTLDFYLNKGELQTQAVMEKPMSRAFDRYAGTFTGGKGNIDIGVKAGNGGGTLSGYTHDDQVTYYNPTPALRVKYEWQEHFIGVGLTHTELKHDGINVIENGADQTTRKIDGREQHVLAELLEEKMTVMNEDYAEGWDNLLHGDGASDAKALTGIRAYILDNPALGSTGGLSRTTYTWWRNRAATAAANLAGSGSNVITSSTADGGALLQFLQEEKRQLKKFARGRTRHVCFAGSDFIGAMERELRANGNYAGEGFRNRGNVDGFLPTDEGVPFGNWNIVYDPVMDELGMTKRLYVIDMANIKLLYMKGEKKKKSNPARPHDRFVMYQGVTTTAGLVARQLNTSGVYDIA